MVHRSTGRQRLYRVLSPDELEPSSNLDCNRSEAQKKPYCNVSSSPKIVNPPEPGGSVHSMRLPWLRWPCCAVLRFCTSSRGRGLERSTPQPMSAHVIHHSHNPPSTPSFLNISYIPYNQTLRIKASNMSPRQFTPLFVVLCCMVLAERALASRSMLQMPTTTAAPTSEGKVSQNKECYFGPRRVAVVLWDPRLSLLDMHRVRHAAWKPRDPKASEPSPRPVCGRLSTVA